MSAEIIPTQTIPTHPIYIKIKTALHKWEELTCINPLLEENTSPMRPISEAIEE
jgi:hypothetical protein